MNAKCNKNRLWCQSLSTLFVVMILAGCSREGADVPASSGQAEAVSQTYEATVESPTDTPAPSATPVPPTDTPAPTYTPIPPTDTPTTTPTSTPLPSPDAKTMIAWKELDLPSEFVAFSPEAIGIQEGANAFSLTIGDELKEYNISGSFVFANGENPNTILYGYTLLLPTDRDRQIFDQLTDDVENSAGYELDVLEGTVDIGDHSMGASGEVGDEHFTEVDFRVDNIGASVFLRHKLTYEPGIDPIQVAKIYAKSIEQPTQYCAITSAFVVPESDIPTFEVEAEGFYPQEGRYIKLEGEIVLDGETIKIGTAKIGGGGETVNEDGSLNDEISFDIKEQLAGQGYQDVQLPEGSFEFILTVGGHFSHCEASQTVTWP